MARRHPPSTPATSKDPPRESSGSKGARGGRWQAPGSAPAATSSFAWQQWLFAAALLIAVLLAYQPAWQGGFIWDDDTHLVNNPVLKPGGLARIWVPGSYANYWPLTATAYWLQFRIWGLNPLGFHLVNIALHALSALLVWRVLVQLRVPGAMFAAAIFALHPVNVESVAWITQLKGILSLLLSLLSVWFYLLYEQQGKQWRFALSLAAFLLSTLAKGIALTLPVVLLACSWWQRGRIGYRNLLRVVPYLLIGTAMSGIEVWMQHVAAGSAGTVVRSDGLLSRVAIAGCAVWFYFWKLIWPLDLCLVYPRWQIDDRDVLAYAPGALLMVILALAWWRRRTWGRPVVMLIVCYVALLLPALGFVNIFFMLYSLVADHWQYAAMIVPCAVFAGVAATLARRRFFPPPAAFVLSLGLLVVLAVLTWRQSRMYIDDETLYRTTIAENPQGWMAHNNLGLLLAARGQVDSAIAHYQKALKIKPDYEFAYDNLGVVLAGRGQVDEAMACFEKALQFKPDHAEAHHLLGRALAGRRQVDEAIAHYQKALEIKPNYAEAHYDLGVALAGRGQVDEAMACFRKALEIKPSYAEAHNNLGVALAGRGHLDEAIAHFQQAVEIKPDDAQFHYNLGLALQKREKIDDAVAQYQEALKIKPAYAAAHGKLGDLLAARNNLDEAVRHYLVALRLDPHSVLGHTQLGRLLSRQGKPQEAEVHFREALGEQPSNAEACSALAMALQQQGKTAESLRYYQESLRLRPDQPDVLNNLAWIRATHPDPRFRDGAQAVAGARRAVELSRSEVHTVDTLAAAYAEAGRFPEALAAARKALELARQQNNQALANALRLRIALYEAGKPLRQVASPPAPPSPKP